LNYSATAPFFAGFEVLKSPAQNSNWTTYDSTDLKTLETNTVHKEPNLSLIGLVFAGGFGAIDRPNERRMQVRHEGHSRAIVDIERFLNTHFFDPKA
jgi:hypothetical protein